jgi:hypothetical protein
MAQEADLHFLIDNAQPVEVEHILRCLDSETAYSTEELRIRLLDDWGLSAQKNLTFSTRRLFDLGLSERAATVSGKPGHIITDRGVKVRAILAIDHQLYDEIMHYLHYTSYDGSASSRKLFWSYRVCCEVVWQRKSVPAVSEVVANVQARIAEQFPSAYARRVGGNFNAGGVTSGWKPWVVRLCPPPFLSDGGELVPRETHRIELVLLALDHVYRSHDYRYGDPVVVDDAILDEVARVFFLDVVCCRKLLSLAGRLVKALRVADTFAGPSVTLAEPYTVESI